MYIIPRLLTEYSRTYLETQSKRAVVTACLLMKHFLTAVNEKDDTLITGRFPSLDADAIAVLEMYTLVSGRTTK